MLMLQTTLRISKHLYSVAGVSNSNLFEDHILTKIELVGRIKRKNVSEGRNKGKKCFNTT